LSDKRCSVPLLEPALLTSCLPLAQEQAGSLNAGTAYYSAEVPHLEQQAIPRAAIANRTNHFSIVNSLGEFGLDSACSIEGIAD
jgi:hypothetical protein